MLNLELCHMKFRPLTLLFLLLVCCAGSVALPAKLHHRASPRFRSHNLLDAPSLERRNNLAQFKTYLKDIEKDDSYLKDFQNFLKDFKDGHTDFNDFFKDF